MSNFIQKITEGVKNVGSDLAKLVSYHPDQHKSEKYDDVNIKTITHTASGASCRVHAFGATMISYKSADGRENLFMSRDAKLDGSKAIRGGIPLVFPIFGPPPSDSGSTMPQHGFARNNMWKIKDGSEYDNDDVAGITYELDLADVENGIGENNDWTKDQVAKDGTNLKLLYEVIISATSLTTTFIIQNTGSVAFNFNCLQHTYYAVDHKSAQNKDKCGVHGLVRYSKIDKVDDANTGKLQDDDDITLDKGEVDCVYVHPEDTPIVKVKVGVGSTILHMESEGQVNGAPAPVSCVVWNPYKDKAKAMSDFGDDQYKEMICVEPGLLGHQPLIQPNNDARLTQIITTTSKK